MTFLAFFYTDVYKIPAGTASAISKALADRFGKRDVFGISLFLSALCLLLFYFYPSRAIALVFATQLAHGFFYGITTPLLWAMIADVADYSEWKNNRRFFEASWMHKYRGEYYFSYSTGNTHMLCYATGDSPYGPFRYRGVILTPVVGWTTHHSIV